jgi:hypothetical protein
MFLKVFENSNKASISLIFMVGSMEFRQKEFRHLNFDNVQIEVEF